MIDFFAVLGLPQRPLVDEGLLQENYLRLAARWHPDAPGGDVGRFRELQAARQVLRNPSDRLRHLLALNDVVVEKNPASPPVELFLKIAPALRKADALSKEGGEVRSPIARAVRKQEVRATARELQELNAELLAWQEVLRGDLALLDRRWPAVEFTEVGRLASLYAYLSRWLEELGSRMFSLGLEKV